MGKVITGFVCGMWFVLICVWTEPTKGQVGFSYFQLNEMKKRM